MMKKTLKIVGISVKKCTICGQTVAGDNYQKCPHCQGKLISIEEEKLLKKNSNYKREVKEKKTSSGVKKNALIVFLACFSICLVGFCCFLTGQLYGSENDENKPQESQTQIEEKKEEKEKEPENTTIEKEEKKSVPEEKEPIETNEMRQLPKELNIEDAVKEIRKLYYAAEELEPAETTTYNPTGTTAYYDENGSMYKMVVPADEIFNYERKYYFDEGELYFAFVFNKKKENRLYFYSEELFRWIDEGGEIHDEEYSNSEFIQWERKILADVEENLIYF